MSLAFAGLMSSCNDFSPKDMPNVPDLPTVSNLTQNVENRVVTISWQYPSTSLEIDGVNIIVNGNIDNVIRLDKDATSYVVKGQPMEVEYLYTVKMRYNNPNGGNYVSEGKTVASTVPYEELAEVKDLKISNIEGRAVTFTWTLPNALGITGVRVGLDGEDNGTIFTEDYEHGATIKGQSSGDKQYRVQVVYDEAYYSNGAVINTSVPQMETKTAFLLLADSPSALEDDDEKAAAAWYYDNYVTAGTGDFITIDQLKAMTVDDFDHYGVIWISVDRVGLEVGWQNLPDGLAEQSTIDALKAYSANGGSLFLSNMATQMTVPLEIVPAQYPINTFGNGAGGDNGDLWSINTHLGWIFQDAGNYYDRTSHAVFQGLTFEDVNGYPYASLPLLGGDYKEDHNSLWDLNPYWNAAGSPAPDCVKWWENTTNSLVLAVWGQVQDHCIAGMVEFNPNATHGRCMAMGLGAYEWNVNVGSNPYQGNIEKLTQNILEYLK